MSENKFDNLEKEVNELIKLSQQLKEVNDAELRDYVINFRQDDPGKKVSNYGGWQSRNIDILDERPLNIEKFIVALQQNVNDAAKMANLPKLQICDYWWNINNKGDYNHPHNHRDSILSGVYYIAVSYTHLRAHET